MTLRHLEIFRAVCAQESITQAAEQLNMAQPAVSVAIRELEAFYGSKLFERMNRRIYLTEAGRTLLQYADTILSQFRESVQVFREAQHSGVCRFGVHVTFGETRLPAILQQLALRLPQVRLQVFVGNTRRNEEMILQNEIDFAVVDNITVSPNAVDLPLCREPMSAVCAPDYPCSDALPLAQLAGERLLLRERGSGTRSSVDAVFQVADAAMAPPLVEGSSVATLLECARRGLGVSILPDSLIADDLRRGTLRALTVTDGRFYRQYFLAYHKNKYLSESVKAVLQAVRDSCREDDPPAA